jgi:hypothetical protein
MLSKTVSSLKEQKKKTNSKPKKTTRSVIFVEQQTDKQIGAENRKRGNPIYKQIHEYKTVRTTCKLMRTVPSTTNCNQSLHPDSVMLCWS